MKYNPEIHHRHSIRLKGYDYSQVGAYFVTICTYKGVEAFGTVMDGQVQLSEEGEIARRVWESLSGRFPGVALDAFVIMPNHVHGIIVREQSVGRKLATREPGESASGEPLNKLRAYRVSSRRYESLGEMVRTFKAATSRYIHKGGNAGFGWQRGYYERIICSNKVLEHVRAYIVNNPVRWREDKFHPDNPDFEKLVLQRDKFLRRGH